MENLDLPCKLCKERGLICTAGDKVRGKRKPERSRGQGGMRQYRNKSLILVFSIPQLLSDEILTSSERMKIQMFYTLWPSNCCGPQQFCSRLLPRVNVPVYNAGLSPSSALFRSAIVVLMSNLKTQCSDSETPSHLQVFYTRAGECVNANATSEIVYSSYIIAAYALICKGSIQDALELCLLFCHGLKAFARSGTARDDEVLWSETLWQGLFIPLFYICRDLLFKNIADPGEQLMNRIWSQLQEILDVSSCILPSDADIEGLPLSMCTETICHKIRSLSIYMQFYMDYFLFRASRHSEIFLEDANPILLSLHKILGQIILLIDQLSNISDYIHDSYTVCPDILDFNHRSTHHDLRHLTNLQPRGLQSATGATYRDAALVSLYIFSRFMKTLLEEENELNEKVVLEVYHSAIALCRVCGSFPREGSSDFMAPSIMERNLFWAGIILRKHQFPTGRLFYFF